MQYMGGKSRIAHSIANIFNEVPRWQEPNSNTIGTDPHLRGGAVLHRAFCKKYHTRLGCVGKRGKQVC